MTIKGVNIEIRYMSVYKDMGGMHMRRIIKSKVVVQNRKVQGQRDWTDTEYRQWNTQETGRIPAYSA